MNDDIDILSINATKIDINKSDNRVHTPGYEIIRHDRVTNGREGALFLCKKCNKCYTIRNDLHMDALENLCLEIRRPRSKPVVLLLLLESFHLTNP